MKEIPGFIEVELGVIGFNTEKESVLAGAGEVGHVEDRVIRLGQSVGDKHSEGRTERGKKNGQLELEIKSIEADVWWSDVIAHLEMDLKESTNEPLAAGTAPDHDPTKNPTRSLHLNIRYKPRAPQDVPDYMAIGP